MRKRFHRLSSGTLKPLSNRGVGQGKPTVDPKDIATFCQKHDVKKFSLFGSILGDDFGPASDVDVLIDIRRTDISMSGLIDMERELGKMFNRKVDLVTERGIKASGNKIRRGEILSTSKLVYVAP